MSSENHCECVGGKPSSLRHATVSWVNYLGAIPSVLNKSKGLKVMHSFGWFRTHFRAMTEWLYIMSLYIENLKKAFRSSHFARWCLQMFFSSSLYFHTQQMKTCSQFQFSRTQYLYLTAGLKKIGVRPMNDQSWNFFWKSPNILGWNPMLRYLVQCHTWVFIHQQSNNVITGLNLQSESKIPNF